MRRVTSYISVTNVHPNKNEKMKINTDYFWFQLFKTRGIGPKTLAAVAKILAAENLNPEILPLNQSDLASHSPELAKILSST